MKYNKINKIELDEKSDIVNITINPEANVKYIDMNLITQEDKNTLLNNK